MSRVMQDCSRSWRWNAMEKKHIKQTNYKQDQTIRQTYSTDTRLSDTIYISVSNFFTKLSPLSTRYIVQSYKISDISGQFQLLLLLLLFLKPSVNYNAEEVQKFK